MTLEYSRNNLVSVLYFSQSPRMFCFLPLFILITITAWQIKTLQLNKSVPVSLLVHYSWRNMSILIVVSCSIPLFNCIPHTYLPILVNVWITYVALTSNRSLFFIFIPDFVGNPDLVHLYMWWGEALILKLKNKISLIACYMMLQRGSWPLTWSSSSVWAS